MSHSKVFNRSLRAQGQPLEALSDFRNHTLGLDTSQWSQIHIFKMPPNYKQESLKWEPLAQMSDLKPISTTRIPRESASTISLASRTWLELLNQLSILATLSLNMKNTAKVVKFYLHKIQNLTKEKKAAAKVPKEEGLVDPQARFKITCKVCPDPRERSHTLKNVSSNSWVRICQGLEITIRMKLSRSPMAIRITIQFPK